MGVTFLPGSRNISSVMQDMKYSLKARFSVFLTAPLVFRDHNADDIQLFQMLLDNL